MSILDCAVLQTEACIGNRSYKAEELSRILLDSLGLTSFRFWKKGEKRVQIKALHYWREQDA